MVVVETNRLREIGLEVERVDRRRTDLVVLLAGIVMVQAIMAALEVSGSVRMEIPPRHSLLDLDMAQAVMAGLAEQTDRRKSVYSTTETP
jgi:hypothetical protein